MQRDLFDEGGAARKRGSSRAGGTSGAAAKATAPGRAALAKRINRHDPFHPWLRGYVADAVERSDAIRLGAEPSGWRSEVPRSPGALQAPAAPSEARQPRPGAKSAPAGERRQSATPAKSGAFVAIPADLDRAPPTVDIDNPQTGARGARALAPTSLDTCDHLHRASKGGRFRPSTREQSPERAARRRTIIAARYTANRTSARKHRAAGLETEAGKIATCRRSWVHAVHMPCGTMRPARSTYSCGDRIGCAHCAHERARKIAERVVALFRDVERPKFWTLTVPNVDRVSEYVYSELRRSFTRLRRRLEKLAPGCVKGGVYAIETTWNEDDGSAHPHIHALIDGAYVRQDILAREWAKASKHLGGQIVDVRAVKDRAGRVVEKLTATNSDVVSEICKYAAKLAEIPVDQLAAFRKCMRGRKLLNPFGAMFGAVVEEDDDHEDDDQGEQEPGPCSCGMEGPWREEVVYLSWRDAIEAALARDRDGPIRALGRDHEERLYASMSGENR